MYEVYLDGKLLYYPGDEVNVLVSGLLNIKLNEAGTFDITVPPINPLYGSFKLRNSELTVMKDGQEIWNGEVRNSKDNIKKEKMIYAVGELAYLNASSQPQKKYTNITPLQMLTTLLVEHNSRVEARKQFAIGIVTVGSANYDWTTNYENTLDYIRSEMCEKLDGYLRIRKENGIRYLDLVRLQDYGKTCQQPIEFGSNMLDYSSGLDADSIVTVIRPLGATIENAPIDGIDAYLTIESVNDGKDYIENTNAINSGIGYVWRTVHFNVLTDPNELKTAGRNWLQVKQFENMNISVAAVDLSELNSDIQSFDLGDSVHTIAKPFGMDKWSYITEKKIDLLNPATRHNISIGEYVKKSYTQQITSEQNTIKNQIPKQNVILELAKKNASEIIKHATEGNVYFINDDSGIPKELLIMDTSDINTAQKIWRWNINGLGYSSTGYNGTFGLAMTMDGQIVADFITVGTLNSIEINNGDGNFTVDKNGNVVANSLSSSNAKITGGSLKVGDKFNVDTSGNVVANSLSSNNANITGGSFKVKKTSFDFDVLTLESDSYIINFTSESLEIFNLVSREFATVNCYGLDLGTFSGSPHTSGSSMLYGRSNYNDNAKIVGNLTVTGTKSRVTSTENYNARLLYCYETPSPMFGDMGEGTLDETGICYVFLDDVFAETIDTDCTYQVFLQPYGNGNCYVSERNSNYFVVKGTENMLFGWEVKATQKDYDTIRLEEYSEPILDNTSEILEETNSYLNNLLYNVESEEF